MEKMPAAGRYTSYVAIALTWFVKGCAQRTGEYTITKVGKDHVNCVGGERTGSNVVQPMVDQLVRANPKIGGPGIKPTLKIAGFEITDRTSQRAKQRITNASKGDEADAIARLPSWCEVMERDCAGSVTTVEVSAGLMVGLMVFPHQD